MIPEYNEKGKLVREVKTEGKSKAADNYRYDDNGNLIELVDSETRREYRFDDKNNVIEHKMFLLDGRRQIRLVFKYNEKGLQSEQIRYDNSEKIVYHTVFEYEYYK
jgi:YD repeat-containing protein